MTYQEVIGQIQGKRRFGSLPGAAVAARMLAALGSPQRGMKLIHIAGTNGKGSVSAFLCEILKAAGVKTGMFTSPHLIDYEERIRVDGRMMDREAVRRIGEELLRTEFGASPTMFDYSLAMALLYFRERRCEAVILETGLGGRLDSTNAVGTPLVTVITKIGYDHTEILGTAIEEIAAEKAGIIKPGTALVTESQLPEASRVLSAAAAAAGVGCHRSIDPGSIRDPHFENGRQVFSYGSYENLTMQMLGTHQYENAVTALTAAELFFARRNMSISDEISGAAGYGAGLQSVPARTEPTVQGALVQDGFTVQRASVRDGFTVQGASVRTEPTVQGAFVREEPAVQGAPVRTELTVQGASVREGSAVQSVPAREEPAVQGASVRTEPAVQGASVREGSAVQGAAMPASALTPCRIRAAVRSGIENAVWPGRMEILRRDPFLMIDGAHNGCGARALRDSLMSLFPGEKFHFLMGVMADKDYGEMADLLLPLAYGFTAVTVENSRALRAEALAGLIRSRGIPAVSARDLDTVLFAEAGGCRHKTIAFGSLYFVGEVRRRFVSAGRHSCKHYKFVTDSRDYDKNDTF